LELQFKALLPIHPSIHPSHQDRPYPIIIIVVVVMLSKSLVSTTSPASAAALFSPLLLLAGRSTMLADAFPTGAGSCAGDAPAVGSPHLASGLSITTGSLADGSLEVVLNGVTLLPDAVVDVPNDGTPDHALEVIAGGGIFRGFLLRAQSLTGDEVAMTPVTNSALSLLCEFPAVGITHTVNDDKTQAGGTVSTAGVTDLTVVFDVTVVVALRDGVSEYYYSQYTVNFASGAEPPVASPVASPVAASPAPVAGTAAPVAGTSAPVAAGTAPPTDTPSEAEEQPSYPTDMPAMPDEPGSSAGTDAPVAEAAPPSAAGTAFGGRWSALTTAAVVVGTVGAVGPVFLL
jgi:hypothetical protein